MRSNHGKLPNRNWLDLSPIRKMLDKINSVIDTRPAICQLRVAVICIERINPPSLPQTLISDFLHNLTKMKEIVGGNIRKLNQLPMQKLSSENKLITHPQVPPYPYQYLLPHF